MHARYPKRKQKNYQATEQNILPSTKTFTMDKNLSNSKPRGRGRPKKTSKIMEQRSSHVPDSDGEIQQQPSAPSPRRLVIEIPSRPRAFEPKKRPNPKGSDQDDEKLSGAEQNPAKRRKKDHIGQDNSKDHNPPEGDDDSSDDPFLDEPKGNKGKGKATGYHLEQPEQVPDEDGDVVFDDLWTLDDESNLLMSWSEDDQTLLDSLPKAEIALWRRSMRLFSVGPEELFLPNVTISRADLPDYAGKDGRAIPNKIHLSTNFCNAFKYIISLPLLAKRRSLLQYLLTKALRLRCGDRCAVPKSFDTQVIDMEATNLLETLRHAGIIGNLTCGQERIFKDILGDRFPEHFHFHEHLKDIVKANSGMKPQNASKNPDAVQDGDLDTYQLRPKDLNNIIKAWDFYRNDPKNSHHLLPSMKKYFDENKILKNRKGDASLHQIKYGRRIGYYPNVVSNSDRRNNPI